MAFRSAPILLIAATLALPVAVLICDAQVFVVGEKSEMADVSTEFHPTRVDLSSTPITERERRELVRNLDAEQGFAHRALPLGDSLILMANGNLVPGGEAYKDMLYKKGESAAPGDRVAITALTVEKDRIVFDLNGGPHLKHRFLRHIQIGDTPLAADDGAQVTGCRVTLVFEGGIPDISAPEVKALLDPIIDFGVKTSAEAFANSLPVFLKDAIAHHDVLVGMDRKMVLAAMGAPLSKERELIDGSKDRHYEEWIYGQVPQTVRFVRFVGDRVTQVRVAALGQSIAVHDKNEMQGYFDPEDTREVALGDGTPGSSEAAPAKPPTILKPGEIAPGSSRQVLKPVSVPSATQNRNDPVAAGAAAPATASAPSGASSKWVEYGTL
jgi:hypothetical protein